MLKEKKENTMRGLLVLMVLAFLLTACIPKELSTSEKVVFTTVRSLQAAKELRVTALKTIGGMYINGTLTDPEFKDRVIKIGDDLQEAINVTSEALQIYYTEKDNLSKEDLSVKILAYQKILGEFTDLVMPYVLEHIDK